MEGYILLFHLHLYLEAEFWRGISIKKTFMFIYTLTQWIPPLKKSTQKIHWQKYKIFYSQSMSKGKNMKCLSPTKKVMTNLDSILKSRDITLPTKVHLLKAMVFPAVMYGCESWTIKKAEHWRIDAFELWCCWRLLRVPWTARRSNQSI